MTVGSRVNARFEHIFLAFENYCVKVNTDRPSLLLLLQGVGDSIALLCKPWLQQPSCRSGTLVSGNIKIMRVFTGVLEKSNFKRQWGRASCARL